MLTNDHKYKAENKLFFDFEKKAHMYSGEVNWIRFFTYQH